MQSGYPSSGQYSSDESIHRIDRLEDGSLHIIDYKTGKTPEGMDDFQLFLYALILSKTMTYLVSKVSYLYLENGVWQSFPISSDDSEQALSKLLEMARQIESEEEYPETVGPLCRFCDFVELCEAGRESEPAISDTEPVDF